MLSTPPPKTTMNAAEWGMLLLGALWGGSFFFARIAVMEMPPLVLVFWRVLIAAGALHIYLLLRRQSLAVALPYAGSLVMLAILNNVIPFSLIFIGQTELGAGLASVLNATTPFWTVLFAHALTADEKLTPQKIGGIMLGVAGVAVMIGPGLLAGLGGPVWAKLVLVGASVSYALAAIYARRFKSLPPAVVAVGQLTGSTLVMLPIVLLVDGTDDLFGASTTTWAAVLALALVSTAFAYILYFTLVARTGATNASLVTLVVPASALLLGVLFLGERLELFEIGGMVLIALGFVTIDGRLLRRR